MKFAPTVFILFVLAFCCTAILAVDYRPDTTFNPVFTANDRVQDILVQADGMIVIGGATCGATGNCLYFLKRLNADGTADATFSSPLTTTSQGSYIRRIKQLPGGQYLVSGEFNISGQRSNYARLNADGSLDTTMATASIDFSYGATLLEPTTDGKFLVCTERTINSQLYKIAHRINSNGTVDPTFRVTFMDGYCEDLKALPDGKFLIVVGTTTGQTQVKPVHRLNSDGSKDVTFDADLPVGSYADALTRLQDGKLLVTSSVQGQNTQHVRRLLPDGALDTTIQLCAGSFFLPQSNGDLITNGCRRWSGYFGNRLKFAKVFANGEVDPTLDAIYIDGDAGGAREAGNGKYYVFGDFRSVQSYASRQKLIRLEPNTTPLKAKYDFDNDGRSDLAVFRPSDRTWYVNQSTAGAFYLPFGLENDKLAAGHYDSDGRSDPAVFRDGILHAYSSAAGHRQLFIGQTGDRPMPGNFEDSGNDIEDIAVRGVRSGAVQWFIREGESYWNPVGGVSGPYSVNGELSTDKPVVGDFNGDSRDELGYFRNGFWYTVDRYNYAPPAAVQFGATGDIPVPGDYDGDRQTDYAIYRPSTGEWWIRRSSLGIVAVRFGVSTDIPVPADYDGDGKQDIAIYRNGNWWQYLSATGSINVQQWGTSADLPAEAQNQ